MVTKPWTKCCLSPQLHRDWKPLWHPKFVLCWQELHKNKVEPSLYSHKVPKEIMLAVFIWFNTIVTWLCSNWELLEFMDKLTVVKSSTDRGWPRGIEGYARLWEAHSVVQIGFATGWFDCCFLNFVLRVSETTVCACPKWLDSTSKTNSSAQIQGHRHQEMIANYIPVGRDKVQDNNNIYMNEYAHKLSVLLTIPLSYSIHGR